MFSQTWALTERGLRVDSRSLSSHLLRLTVAGIVLLMVWIFIADYSWRRALGREIVQALCYLNAVLLTILGAVYFGSAITEEKEERTLPLLMLANVSAWTLISGKIVPRLLTVMFILAMQIPLTFLAITLGGVLKEQVFAAYLMLAGYLLLVIGVGTLCSVYFRVGGNATGATGFLLLGYHLGPWIGLLSGRGFTMAGHPFWSRIGNVLLAICAPLTEVNLFSRLAGVFSSVADEAWLTPAVVVEPLIGLIALGLAVWIFPWCNQNLDQEAAQRRKVLSERHTRRAWQRWPIAWREYAIVNGGGWSAWTKVFVFGLVCVLIGTASSGFVLRDFNLQYACVGTSIAMLVFLFVEATLGLAQTVSTELREQTWSTLATLPHSTSTLTYSKLWGCCLTWWPALLWLIPSVAIAAWPWPQTADRFMSAYSMDQLRLLSSLSHFLLFFQLVAGSAVLTRQTWIGIGAGVIALLGISAVLNSGYELLMTLIWGVGYAYDPNVPHFWNTLLLGVCPVLLIIVFIQYWILILLRREAGK